MGPSGEGHFTKQHRLAPGSSAGIRAALPCTVSKGLRVKRKVSENAQSQRKTALSPQPRHLPEKPITPPLITDDTGAIQFTFPLHVIPIHLSATRSRHH